MFERFSAQARSVVVHAQQDARELDQPSIGTPLILLGIAEERDTAGGRVLSALGVGEDDIRNHIRSAVARERAFSVEDALRSVGIDLDEVRRSVEEAFGPGALDRGTAGGGRRGHIPFTRGGKKALELALREALALGHNYIGTEHLLLGLVREDRCSAVRILAARGFARDRVRAVVLSELVNGGDEPRRTA